MAQRMCSKLLALLHFNLQSCMTCNSKTKVLIRLFGILSLLLFAQAVKFGTNSKTLNPCERCRIVVDSFREVSLAKIFFIFISNVLFSGFEKHKTRQI